MKLRWMRRGVCALLALAWVWAGVADVVCCTWNMKWFPSGRRDLRASAEEERANIHAAGARIDEAFRAVSGGQAATNAILFVQEVRDAATCAALAAQTGLRVAGVSDFRDAAGIALWQQTAILTTLPVVQAGFEPWHAEASVQPPRGFTYALLDAGEDGRILCFSLHLKSNMNRTSSDFEEQANIFKRETSAAQILARIARLRKDGVAFDGVVVAGDFNTNEDDPAFVSEATLRSFYGAHFRSCFSGLAKSARVTWPGNGSYADATFDYILYRGFPAFAARRIHDGAPLSDHHLVLISLRRP